MIKFTDVKQAKTREWFPIKPTGDTAIPRRARVEETDGEDKRQKRRDLLAERLGYSWLGPDLAETDFRRHTVGGRCD
jgi:hypothetical protein